MNMNNRPSVKWRRLNPGADIDIPLPRYMTPKSSGMDVRAAVKDATPLEVFEKAIDNVKPRIEVRSKRVGGANYQVPMQVSSKRQLSLSIRWIREGIRAGKGRPTCQRMADELMAAFRGEGTAMTTRENVHRMADANKAFAHFAW